MTKEILTEEEQINFYNLLEKFINSCDMPQMHILRQAEKLKALMDDETPEEEETDDKLKKLEPIFAWLDSKDYNVLDDYHRGVKDILNVLIGDEDIDSLIAYFNGTNEE
jgi:hypothetical protein